MRREARFPEPTPSAVADARNLVRTALASVGLDDRVADAALVVSELVTNALVHTTGGLDLRITGDAERVRVEVRDTSPLLPRPAQMEAVAMSGRGLLLVARLSSAWGSEPEPSGGKVVWFEVAAGADEPADALTADDLISFWTDGDESAAWPAERGQREERDVVVRALSTARLVAAKARGEDLLREATLVVAEPCGRQPRVLEVATRLNALMRDLARLRLAIRSQALAAAARGESEVDLVLRVAVDDADAIDAYSVALDEADRLARDGLLLSLPPSPDDAAFRRGYLRAIADHVRGGAGRVDSRRRLSLSE